MVTAGMAASVSFSSSRSNSSRVRPVEDKKVLDVFDVLDGRLYQGIMSYLFCIVIMKKVCKSKSLLFSKDSVRGFDV
jgi:hypothetical protein